jgi:hypothetical protein
MGSIQNAAKRLRRLRKSKMPKAGIVCVCPITVIMGRGCLCGAAQAEKALKSQKSRAGVGRTDCAAMIHLPAEGEVVKVRRAPGSDLDHGGIPFKIWVVCDGKEFEVLLSIWEDIDAGKGLALLDISATTGTLNDYWFPLDSLYLPK